MVEAAESAGVPLMVAQVLPFFPEFHYAAECVRSGRFGKLRAAHFRRVICQPDWSSDMSDFRKLGGWGIDLHIHDNHFISLICGVPNAVFSRGILQDGFVNHLHTQYIYDDAELAVSAISGGIAGKGLQFAHGYELYFQEATVAFSAGTLGRRMDRGPPADGVQSRRQARSPGTQRGHGMVRGLHQRTASRRQRRATPARRRICLSGTLARDALKLCYAEAESIAVGEIVSL